MNKRHRNILILLAVLLAVLAANMVLFLSPGNGNENAETEEIIYISNYSVGSTTRIEIDNEYGNLVLVSNDGVWYVEGDEDIQLDQGVTAEAAYMLTHIVGERIVSDSEDINNLYGMLSPAATITTHHDGILEQIFIIGDCAPIEGEYYLQSSIFKQVYTVDSSYYAFGQIRVEDLMALAGVDIEHADMQRFEIENTLGEQYTIERTADDNNISLCYWEFTEPFNHDVDTAVLYGSDDYEGMITYITQLVAEGVLGYRDTDLEAYRQDEPVFTASIYGHSDQLQSFAIGDYGDEDNFSIIFSDDNVIYSVAKDRVPFIEYSAYVMAEANLNLINIDSVEAIAIDLPDLHTEIGVERVAKKNADGTDYRDADGNLAYQVQISIGELDENNISATNIYEQKIFFYQDIVSIKIEDLIIDGVEYGNKIGSIVFDMESKYMDVYSIEFYEYSQSHYAAKKNGEDVVYLVNKKSIEYLAQRFEMLLAGEITSTAS